MKINLDENLEDFLKIIAKNALIQNVRVFFVGGFVRDLIIEQIKTNPDKPIKNKHFNAINQDIDLIIEGNAIDFINAIVKNYRPDKAPIKIKSIHQDFATVKVEFNPKSENKNQNISKPQKPIFIDIASTRSEKYPFSGCLPELLNIGIGLEDDVKRRDFSVNSLYLEIKLNLQNQKSPDVIKPENSKLDFEIIDFTGGINDIKSKTLRVLHKKSYIDDPTRILRGLDFKYRFGFDFSLEDKKLINQYLKKIEYNNSSKDRIKNVFLKVLSSDNSDKIFQDIVDKKLYKILFDFEIDSINFDKTKKIIELFKKYYQNSIDNNVISKFYFSILENKEIEKLSPENNLKNNLDIKRAFEKFKIDEIMYYFYRTNDKNIPIFLKIKDISLFIKGSDLLELNFEQGKIIGEILDKILLEKLKNPDFFKTKEDEIKKAQQLRKNNIK